MSNLSIKTAADGLSGEIKFGGVVTATVDANGVSIPAGKTLSVEAPTAQTEADQYGRAGQVLQVVTATTSTPVSSSSSAFVSSGLTASITPKFSTSKILVAVHIGECIKTNADAANRVGLDILINGTTAVLLTPSHLYTGTAIQNTGGYAHTISHLPASVSAQTYLLRFASTSNFASVGVQYENSPSTMTLIEVAA